MTCYTLRIERAGVQVDLTGWSLNHHFATKAPANRGSPHYLKRSKYITLFGIGQEFCTGISVLGSVLLVGVRIRGESQVCNRVDTPRQGIIPALIYPGSNAHSGERRWYEKTNLDRSSDSAAARGGDSTTGQDRTGRGFRGAFGFGGGGGVWSGN